MDTPSNWFCGPAERNIASKAAASSIKAHGKDSTAAAAALATAAQVKAALPPAEQAMAATARQLQAEALQLPNWSHSQAPVGSESSAVVVDTVGAPPRFEGGHTPATHEVIGTACGLFSFNRAASTTGSRFVTLTGQGVLLQQALVAFALDRAVRGGFRISAPPDVARAAAVEACGFAPRDNASQIYSLAGTDLCLVGTGEIPLMAQHAGAVFLEQCLPRLEAAVTHCFRREAGGGGQAEGGLYRLHQFTKVELTAVTTEAQSESVLEDLLSWQKRVLGELGLYARVLDMPTEELGAAAARKVSCPVRLRLCCTLLTPPCVFAVRHGGVDAGAGCSWGARLGGGLLHVTLHRIPGPPAEPAGEGCQGGPQLCAHPERDGSCSAPDHGGSARNPPAAGRQCAYSAPPPTVHGGGYAHYAAEGSIALLGVG